MIFTTPCRKLGSDQKWTPGILTLLLCQILLALHGSFLIEESNSRGYRLCKQLTEVQTTAGVSQVQKGDRSKMESPMGRPHVRRPTLLIPCTSVLCSRNTEAQLKTSLYFNRTEHIRWYEGTIVNFDRWHHSMIDSRRNCPQLYRHLLKYIGVK